MELSIVPDMHTNSKCTELKVYWNPIKVGICRIFGAFTVQLRYRTFNGHSLKLHQTTMRSSEMLRGINTDHCSMNFVTMHSFCFILCD